MLACNSITPGQQVDLVSLFTRTLAEDPVTRSDDFQTLLKLLKDDRNAAFNPPRRYWKMDSGIWKVVDPPPPTLPISFPIKKRWAPSMRQLRSKDQWESFHPMFKVGLVDFDRSQRANSFSAREIHDRTSACGSPYSRWHCSRAIATLLDVQMLKM